jgi:nitrite reductase/ring-hydroxylating ferredoxin subunit
MDGHLRAADVIICGLHESKFTDGYCTKQPKVSSKNLIWVCSSSL